MNLKETLSVIRKALFTGQISAAKVDAQRGLPELEAFIQELQLDAWAGRVIEEYADEKGLHFLPSPVRVFNERPDGKTFVLFGYPHIAGGSRAEVRLIAANLFYPELPADVRAYVGGRP